MVEILRRELKVSQQNNIHQVNIISDRDFKIEELQGKNDDLKLKVKSLKETKEPKEKPLTKDLVTLNSSNNLSLASASFRELKTKNSTNGSRCASLGDIQQPKSRTSGKLKHGDWKMRRVQDLETKLKDLENQLDEANKEMARTKLKLAGFARL